MTPATRDKESTGMSAGIIGVVKRFSFLIFVAMAVLSGTNVSAQESSREWRSGWLTPSTAVYNTQREIELALEQQHGRPGFPLVIKSQSIGPTSTSISYWHGVRRPVIGEWGQFDNQFINPGLASEDEMVSATLIALNAYSNDPHCSTSHPQYKKATFVAVGDWVSSSLWNGGIYAGGTKKYKATYLRASGSSNCFVDSPTINVYRSRSVACPNADFDWSSSYGGCINTDHSYSITGTPLVCDTCAQVGNPVDVTSGEKFEPEPDLNLDWISFTRYFHSGISSGKGGFGYGWANSHGSLLLTGDSAAGTVGFVRHDGYQISFRRVGFTTSYESIDGNGDRVVVSGGKWTLYQPGKVTSFDAKGRIALQAFDDGTSYTFSYDPQLRLVKISHSTGRSVEFQYDSTGAIDDPRIVSITSNGAILAAYVYDADRRLSSIVYPDGNSRIYHYEDIRFPLNLTGITDESGLRFSTFIYDAKGRVISSTHSGNADQVTLSYTAQGGAVVTDALSRQSDYGLTAGDVGTKYRKVTGITDSTGTVGRTYYDESVDFRRRLDTSTGRDGVQTKHSYAEATDGVTGAPVSIHTTTEALGLPQQRTSEEHRESATNRLLMTKAGARETRYTRNLRFQPSAITGKDTATGALQTSTMTYCEQADVTANTCPLLGLLNRIDGPRTDVVDTTSYTYYPSNEATCATVPATCPHRKGDLWKVTNALGQVTEILAYDGAGRVLSVKDANGVITDLEYHPRGWLTARKTRGANASVETDDAITQIEYWPTGLVKKVIQPDGAFTSYTYDAAHRLTDIADNAGNTIHYTLDNAGNRTQEDTQDPGNVLKRTLSRVYNQLGQLQTQADAQANPTDFAYDANGNTDTVTDALGRVTDNDYDPLNRFSRTLQNVGGINAETKFQYDAQDNLTQVTDPKGLNTTYTYNGLGDLTQLVSPDTGTTAYTYDSAGNRQTQTDARNQTSTYSYDALNRLTGIAYATSSLNVAYTYDTTQAACTTAETFSTGRLTQLADASGTTQYCYDRFGNLVRKVQTTNGIAFIVRYAYTLAGQLSSVTYPDGAIASYIRDAQGRTTQVNVQRAGATTEVLLNQASYHPFGPVAGWTYGNGRQLLRPLNQNYQPTAIQDTSAGGLSVGFAYDPVGNLTQLTPAGGATPLVKFDYDALSRLITFKDGPTDVAIESYAYDATGNRQSFTNSVGTQAYIYPSTNHHLTQVGATVRSYDNAGNTTAIGGTAKEFVYDDTGRMSQVKQNAIVQRNYAYNGKGEQVRKYLGTSNTYTLYDESGHWLGDYDSTGAALHQAIWLDDLPVGLIANGNQLHYVEPDHLGTPRVVIEVARNVPVWTWDLKSEAFGNSVPNQDPDADANPLVLNMRFPGQRYDAASGLNQNGFRDYDAESGRYPQSDPLGLRGGINTYSYAFSNPLMWIDPDGLQVRGATIQGPSMTGAAGAGGAYNPNNPNNVNPELPPTNSGGGFPQIKLPEIPEITADGLLESLFKMSPLNALSQLEQAIGNKLNNVCEGADEAGYEKCVAGCSANAQFEAQICQIKFSQGGRDYERCAAAVIARMELCIATCGVKHGIE